MKLQLPERWPKIKYLKLGPSDPESEDDTKTSLETSPKKSYIRGVIPWMAHIILVGISSTLLLAAIQTRAQTVGPAFTHEYATAVQSCGLKAPLELSGEFEAHSAWRGGKDADVDAAWAGLELNSAMSVPRSEIEKIKKLRNSSVVLPDGGYMASIGGFHQMHCLNVLRKASYLEYYVVHEPDFFAQPTVRKHIDHCVEMLRQILMCSADMHLVTYDWVDGKDYPWPDLNTNQFCRDYKSVHEWGKERVAKTDAVNGMILKPANAITRKLPPH